MNPILARSLAASAVATVTAIAAPPRFVESRLAFESKLVSYEVVDVDADARADLLVVTVDRGGRRLALHRQRADGSFANESDWSLSVPAEVVAFGLLDCRPEPGDELLLFTPAGVLSASFTKAGLAGNARVEVRQAIYPEIAEADRLTRWSWILDVDQDGADDLVLPEIGRLGCFSVTKEGGWKLERRGELPSRFDGGDKPQLPRELAGDDDDDDEKGYDRRALRLFTGVSSSLPRTARPALLDRRRRWDLPRLGFWNADEKPDALLVDGDRLTVIQQGDRLSFTELPPIELGAVGKDKERSLELVDFEEDAIPTQSELVRITADGSGLNKSFELVITGIEATGALATEARAVLLIQASDADFAFRDADGDGYKDLVLNTTQLPSGIASLAAVRVDVALELYRGHADGSLSRKPDARFARTFTPEKLARIREATIFHLSGDYDGDGRDDIVLMDDEGKLRIHRLVADGGSLAFAEDPLLPPYAPPDVVVSCWAFDFNSDPVSDLCLRFEQGLLVFVSQREGGQ